MKQAIGPDEMAPTQEQLVSIMPKLLLHAKALTRSEDLARDLLQDTCLRTIDRIDQGRGTVASTLG